jgi:hypothetical protein
VGNYGRSLLLWLDMIHADVNVSDGLDKDELGSIVILKEIMKSEFK